MFSVICSIFTLFIVVIFLMWRLRYEENANRRIILELQTITGGNIRARSISAEFGAKNFFGSVVGLSGQMDRNDFCVEIGQIRRDGGRTSIRVSMDFPRNLDSMITYYGASRTFEGTASGLYGERQGDFFVKGSDPVAAKEFFQKNESDITALSTLATEIQTNNSKLIFFMRNKNANDIAAALKIASRIASKSR